MSMKAKRISRVVLGLIGMISVISCAKARPKQKYFNEGLGTCYNQRLGYFSVDLQRYDGFPGMMIVSVTATQVNSPGEYVRVAVTNRDLDVLELAARVTLVAGKKLFRGPISRDEVMSHPILIVAPSKDVSPTLLDTVSEDKEALCKIPITDNSGEDSTGVDL